MKFTDLLAFAKAGYSAADVKELLAINTNETDPETPNGSDSDKSIPPISEEEDTTGEETPAPVEDTSKDEEIENLKKQIKNLQSQILNKDLSEGTKETDEDILKKLALEFL